MKIAVKVLKIIGIAILVIIVLLAILIFRIFTAPMVPKDYTKTVDTGGAIESKYLSMGAYEVKYTEAEAALVWLLEQNSDPDSVFYQKVDTEHIGISGHSQGGVAVFNAVSEQPHGELYTCAVSLSPTGWELAMAIGLEYDPSKMTTPALILAAPENDVITLDGVKGLSGVIPAGTVRALRPGMDHGKMLYSADGYVTAWFMWLLQGDQEAAKAFVGDNAELLANPFYQDQQVKMQK